MIYAYLRVSTDEQDVANQKDGIIRYCEYQNIEVNKFIEEEGISGKIDYKKRKLGKLIKELKKGDMLIVSEISRLSRSMMDTFEMMKILTQKEVEVYCVKENMKIDNSALGLMIMSVFAFSAQIERERISERTKEALARLKAQGKKLGRAAGTHNASNKLDKEKNFIALMLMKGCSKSYIARKVGATWGTVSRYIKKENLDKPNLQEMNYEKYFN